MCAYVSSQFLPFKHVQLSGHLAVPSGLLFRMARQFLETLWPMFGFARFLGMFPCKRLRTEDGKIELKPINWKIHWALFACFNVLVLGLIIASYAWISFKAEIPMADVTQCQNKIRGEESTMDIVTSSIFWLVMLIGSFVIQVGNFKMRQELCEISSKFDRVSQEEGSLVSPFLTVCGLLVITIVTSSSHYGWLINTCLNVNWIDVIPLCVSFGFLLVFGCTPIFVFFAFALECFSALSYESTNLKHRIEQCKQDHHALQDCFSKMITLMEKVRSLLSRNIFWVMVILSVYDLLWLYLVPVSFIYYSESKELIILLFAAISSLFVICFFAIIWLFNIRAQKVTDQVHQLKNCLREIFISATFMVTFEGQIVPASFMKDRIMDKMNCFNGFDGKGYFVLGKSFLTNLLTLLATYFVILLQFKMSE